MPEFFLELFSEEIPARMQRDAAQALYDRCQQTFQFLRPVSVKAFYGPRRIAYSATINTDDSVGKTDTAEARGPREGAPDQAIDGFLKKFNGERGQLVIENGYYILRRTLKATTAKHIIETDLVKSLSRFPWPKSMRWGQSGEFTWVRPLRRIVCLLDHEVIPIKFGPVIGGNETEGHRFMAPGAFPVESAVDWMEKLKDCFAIADPKERRQIIVDGLSDKAASLRLSLVDDPGLLDEVNGLVEWPVPLIGKIDEDFMDLPPEVRELSMKVNQRFFALRDGNGAPAPYFAFVANIKAADGGAAVIAGNERVLRARLSDARHFWNTDLKTPLNELLPKLEKITFHAEIGSQLERASRISNLAGKIADALYASGYEVIQAGQAGLLAKADLASGMVGEFPELQGIIGGYYAERHMHGWDGSVVGPAIKTHYLPKGPSDPVPRGTVAVSVALADKIDTLIQFFRIGEKPTGSSDPFALRRAALGIIRIILENNLSLPLLPLLEGDESLFEFIIERLRVKLRNEGKRYDVLSAVLAVSVDDDLVRLIKKVNAITDVLTTDYGTKLLNAYRRSVNILRIEEAKDGPYTDRVNPDLCKLNEEVKLYTALNFAIDDVFIGSDHTDAGFLADERFDKILQEFSTLSAPVDNFFDKVTVNDAEPELRRNRLRLLANLRGIMHQIADFSKIEG